MPRGRRRREMLAAGPPPRPGPGRGGVVKRTLDWPAGSEELPMADVYLPMMVLEELDNGKKGMNDAARNARQVSR